MTPPFQSTILPPYRARFWPVGNDFAQSSVQAITQTADGFLWVGTQNGLARFDGDRFEFISLPPANDSSSQRINALCPDDQGNLWIGAGQSLLCWKAGHLVPVPRPPQWNDLILSLTFHQDSLWIGTSLRLFQYKNEKFSWIREINATADRSKNLTAGQAIRALEIDAQGGLWTAAKDQLVLLQNESVATNYSLADFKPDAIRALCLARDGSLWIGSTYGLIQFREGKFIHYSKLDGLPDNNVSALHEDRYGNLWVGTYGGLCRLADGKFHIEISGEGEPYNLIFCFFEDRENNLWIGSKDGLHQLNVQPFTTLTTRHGLAHNNVMSVYEDGESHFWIGTWGGGLHCLRDGKMTIYSSASHPQMLNDMILALHGARDGSLWFGEDYDGGLYRLKAGEFQHFGQSQGVVRSGVRALLEDRTGRLLVGHAARGLGFVEKGKVRFVGYKQGLPSQSVRCLLEAQDGNIWIGTEAGLVCWTNKLFQTFTTKNGLSDPTILALYEDSAQNIWIGTASGGLNRLRQGRFTFYDRPRGLPDNNILEVLEDDLENLWLASRAGIFRIRKKQFDDFDAGKIQKISGTAFGKADGMASQVCVGVAKPSACKTKDGRLWFATTKGLAVTDPQLQISKNEKPPFVVIRQVLADKKVQSLKFEVSSSERRRDGTANLKLETENLKPGNGELEFHYAALSYTAPEKNRFKYKLEGVDSDWVEAGARRTAFYSRVPPGSYTFRVIACNNDGVWNPLGAKVNLSLPPHLWQTWWFQFFSVAASLSCAAAGARHVTKKRMHRKFQRLEQQHAVEKERSRIAKDIHDDLGANLTQIMLLSDLTESAEDAPPEIRGRSRKIASTARQMVQSMDEIVWAVNPKNDTLDNLLEYLSLYADEFFENSSVECHQEMPVDVPACPLPAEIRHGLFLVVKEALHNVLKHAGASAVSLRIAVAAGLLKIEIADNGRGFDPQELKAGRKGNGLENMRKRLGDLGGCGWLESRPGHGTQWRIEVKLTPQRIS